MIKAQDKDLCSNDYCYCPPPFEKENGGHSNGFVRPSIRNTVSAQYLCSE